MSKTKRVGSATEPLAAADIKRIRESLGLNQVEAGELLGGGIRAFQKYESGTVVPAATTMSLLRILEADPTALGALTGTAMPVQQTGLRPFEITGAHVAALGDRFMVALTRRLLTTEAAKNGIPPDRIHVAANITAADGGEDARITWTGGPARTSYLPSRDCLLQVKAANVTPAVAAKDVLTTAGDVEPAIRQLLEDGGNYIMLCNRPYTRRAVGEREVAIRGALTVGGLKVKAAQVAFRDADQVAAWVNEHPSVATWVLEQTQPGLATSLRSWTHWAGRHEHENPFVADERLALVREKVRVAVDTEREVVRVVGLSGLGKSRLVLEALADDDEGSVQSSDLVLYGVETELGTTAVKGAVQFLADLGRRAVIVIDRCSEDTHVDLAAMVRRSSSKLSLITIDHEIPPGPPYKGTVIVERASNKVVEAVLKGIVPGLPSEDLRRLISFSNGFPQLAVLVAETWSSDAPLTGVTKEYLIDQVVVGRRPSDRQRILQAAKLLSAFGMLGFRNELADELEQVASLVEDLSVNQLRIQVSELVRRRVVQPRGRFATIQPRPIAHNLAERQWLEWSQQQWEDVLTSLPQALSTRAAKQLAQLNRTVVAGEVARYLCRGGGPFDSFDAFRRPGSAAVLDYLSQIDASAVGELLARAFDTVGVDELMELEGDARSELRWASQRIAFPPETFELGANLLLRLALAENETWANNCTAQFKSLFPVYLGDTAARGDSRIAYLDALISKADAQLDPLLAGALESGSEIQHFSRAVGIESHGLRPALEPWNPSDREARAYIAECLDRRLVFALRDDELGRVARLALANDLRALAIRGFLDFAETAVASITAKYGSYWPAALSSLGDVVNFDLEHLPLEYEPRVRALIASVTPSDLGSRLRLLVTEMPWDYPCDTQLDFDEREEVQRKAIYDLADEALNSPDKLAEGLPGLCIDQQRMAGPFGSALAEHANDKLGWLWKIIASYKATPTDRWNSDLLTSYLASLAESHPRLVNTFKRRASFSPQLAWLVPLLSFKMDIPPADVLLVCEALRSQTLPARFLNAWTFGGRLAKLEPAEVAPLFDELFSSSAQASVGFDLLGMYAHGDRQRLEHFRPQIRLAAQTGLSSTSTTMNDHHFANVMTWMLSHGRDDADARAVALLLARQLIERTNTDSVYDDRSFRPLLPLMLRRFPEVVWPLISSAITSSPKSAWRFQHVLGKGFSFGRNPSEAPILELSEDTLMAWCHAHPDVAPAFLATILPLLTSDKFQPLVQRIIDEFGERPDVQTGLASNMQTFGWSGSMTTYYELYRSPLSSLKEHAKSAVRQWARKMLGGVERQISHERDSDEEHDANYD